MYIVVLTVLFPCVVFVQMEHLVTELAPKRLCLEAGALGNSMQLKKCAPTSPYQKWQFTHYHAE